MKNNMWTQHYANNCHYKMDREGNIFLLSTHTKSKITMKNYFEARDVSHIMRFDMVYNLPGHSLVEHLIHLYIMKSVIEI